MRLQRAEYNRVAFNGFAVELYPRRLGADSLAG
jgi:hypothetical protein